MAWRQRVVASFFRIGVPSIFRLPSVRQENGGFFFLEHKPTWGQDMGQVRPKARGFCVRVSGFLSCNAAYPAAFTCMNSFAGAWSQMGACGAGPDAFQGAVPQRQREGPSRLLGEQRQAAPGKVSGPGQKPSWLSCSGMAGAVGRHRHPEDAT